MGSIRELIELIIKLQRAGKDVGLGLNCNKTKYMKIETDGRRKTKEKRVLKKNEMKELEIDHVKKNSDY